MISQFILHFYYLFFLSKIWGGCYLLIYIFSFGLTFQTPKWLLYVSPGFTLKTLPFNKMAQVVGSKHNNLQHFIVSKTTGMPQLKKKTLPFAHRVNFCLWCGFSEKIMTILLH